MQALGIILVLISVGTMVGPIAAVTIMYSNNLEGLVITPQIKDIMNGNSALLPINSGSNNNNNNNYNDDQYNYTDNNGENSNNNNGFMSPVLVSSQIDSTARTVTVVANVTNPLGYDLTVNSFNSTIVCSQDNYQIGVINLGNPVMIPASQTAQVTITGYWTQDAENHVLTSHPGTTSIAINLVDTTIDVNGIVVQSSAPISAGSIPIS
jgi:hypothetical protein